MKRKLILILITILFVSIFLIACLKQELKANTPVNTAMALQNYMKAGNYKNFDELFSAGRRETVSVDQFDKLAKITTEASEYKHYELIKFTNGEMFLVLITQDKLNGEYKVEDIKRVPDEMKSLFETKLSL